MATAKITLYGFAKYLELLNDDLFANMTLPTSTYLDKTTLIKNILLRGGEFEVLYADPYFMKEAIGVWSTKWNRTITKWCAALAVSYDPLYNYDRKEEYTDISKGNVSDSGTVTSSSTNEDTTSAYNESAYQPDNKSVASGSNISKGTSSSSNTMTHNAHLYGNIGVTTSQQMLEAELDLQQWNLYEKITDLFLTEFAIPVY